MRRNVTEPRRRVEVAIDPVDGHPRRRLAETGAESLSDVELIEILLRSGNRSPRARELARGLIQEHGGLAGFVSLEPVHLRRLGVSEPRAAVLAAAVEIACRVAKARMPRRQPLERPDSVAAYLNLRYGRRDRETMGALFLNVRNRLIGETELFRGTQEQILADPRVILKEALLRSASAIVLFHTHPSGDPSPSDSDWKLTHRLSEAGDLMGIRLLDHLILGGNGRWTSMYRRPAGWW